MYERKGEETERVNRYEKMTGEEAEDDKGKLHQRSLTGSIARSEIV